MKRQWACEQINRKEHLVTELEMKERLERVWEMLLSLDKPVHSIQEATKTLDVKGSQDRSAS